MSTAAVLFFDPSCPWTWVTSRWLVGAADQRHLDVHWRPFSLAVKNEGRDDEHADTHRVGHRDLRVLEAARDVAGGGAAGDRAVGRLYTEIGTRRFTDDFTEDGPCDVDVAAALSAAGLDPGLAAAADDDAWDKEIAASTHDAVSRAAPDIGSPVVGLAGETTAFFGPILSAAPEGEEAGRLWDAVVALSGCPCFSEVKRARADGPDPTATC